MRSRLLTQKINTAIFLLDKGDREASLKRWALNKDDKQIHEAVHILKKRKKKHLKRWKISS
jgi:hypothetical protein